MSISFQSIDQACVTFTSYNAVEDQLVKMSGRSTVAACADGDNFCGLAVHRRGNYCSVQLEGFVTVGYTGTAPAMGWTALAANGAGGVKAADSGRTYLVVHSDLVKQTVTFKL